MKCSSSVVRYENEAYVLDIDVTGIWNFDYRHFFCRCRLNRE